jgi:hypothetical protein
MRRPTPAAEFIEIERETATPDDPKAGSRHD